MKNWILMGGILLSGCASLIDGTTQEVSFHSHPAGVTIKIDGQPLTTPGKILLQRGSDHLLTVDRPFGEPIKHWIQQEPNWTILVNALLGLLGVLTYFVDLGSGAAYQVEEPIFVNLDTGIVQTECVSVWDCAHSASTSDQN